MSSIAGHSTFMRLLLIKLSSHRLQIPSHDDIRVGRRAKIIGTASARELLQYRFQLFQLLLAVCILMYYADNLVRISQGFKGCSSAIFFARIRHAPDCGFCMDQDREYSPQYSTSRPLRGSLPTGACREIQATEPTFLRESHFRAVMIVQNRGRTADPRLVVDVIVGRMSPCLPATMGRETHRLTSCRCRSY
jgi:hypothetical protein